MRDAARRCLATPVCPGSHRPAAGDVNAASASVPSDRSTRGTYAAAPRGGTPPALGDALAACLRSQRARASASVRNRCHPPWRRGLRRQAPRRPARGLLGLARNTRTTWNFAPPRAGEGTDPAQQLAGEKAARTVTADSAWRSSPPPRAHHARTARQASSSRVQPLVIRDRAKKM